MSTSVETALKQVKLENHSELETIMQDIANGRTKLKVDELNGQEFLMLTKEYEHDDNAKAKK